MHFSIHSFENDKRIKEESLKQIQKRMCDTR